MPLSDAVADLSKKAGVPITLEGDKDTLAAAQGDGGDE